MKLLVSPLSLLKIFNPQGLVTSQAPYPSRQGLLFPSGLSPIFPNLQTSYPLAF